MKKIDLGKKLESLLTEYGVKLGPKQYNRDNSGYARTGNYLGRTVTYVCKIDLSYVEVRGETTTLEVTLKKGMVGVVTNKVDETLNIERLAEKYNFDKNSGIGKMPPELIVIATIGAYLNYLKNNSKN